jgi:hypothetical protein
MYYQAVKQLIENDPKLNSIRPLSRFNSYFDPTHLERRQQQRAIPEQLIKVAIAYGMKRIFRKNAIAFSLTDRALLNTPYCKFVDKLRGLTVICTPVDDGYAVHTVYWDSAIKSKSVKFQNESLKYTFC